MNQQLLDYIQQQLELKIGKEQIKESLITSGWQDADIDEALETIDKTSSQSKKRRWKRIVLIIISLIIISITAFLSLPRFLNLFAKDIPSINDSDILLKKINVPDNQNAYFDLIKLDDVIREPEGKSELIINMATGKAWDEAVAEEIVSQNDKAFSYFSEAARRPKFQDPAFADPSNITPRTIVPPMNTWRRMARLSAIRAMYLARQGKDKEAIEEALNSVKIGQKIQESQASLLIEYLVAMSMKGYGLETAQRVVLSSSLSGSELTSYVQELTAYYKNEDGLTNSFKGEYHTLSWSIDAIASGDKEALQEFAAVADISEKEFPEITKGVKDNYYFQPNKTKLLFAEYTRANIKSASQPCGEIKAAEILRSTPADPFKLHIEENAIGKLLYDLAAVSLSNISIKKCEEDLLIAATQVVIAIKAYKNDTGGYPSSLNDLVPRYLTSIPVDPFDGKALKYSPAKKIVYSIGQDLLDSGGSTGDDWRKMPDPTFKIVF